MMRHEQTGAYAHQTYYERRTPSADAASVRKWIIAPSLLAAALGGMLFSGIGLAGTGGPTFGFIIGLFMLGSGLVGIGMLILRVVTFDRTGNITINQSTPVAPEQPAQQAPQTISGNRPVMVPTNEPHTVAYHNRSYSFEPRQLRLMIDRIEDGNTTVARDAFGIATSDYPELKIIMAGLDYWRVERVGVEWTPAGIEWLKSRMRLVNR